MKTILLIEDEDAICIVASAVLAREGYEVLVAGSAIKAQELWQQRQSDINLVIADNSLPDGSGFELVQRLEREKPSLKVIVSSGLSVADLPWRYTQLDKPFTVHSLLALVRGAFAAIELPPE